MRETNILKKTQDTLETISRLIDNSNWKNNYSLSLKTLREELNTPCVLAVAGKVKAGKSSLINSLLGIDLAMTGTTETTATINVFKKGKPFSPDKPVLCQWLDGTKEWMEKDFLNRLQGTGEETLKVTSEIDRLVFYIDDNPLLEDVTLVDTPGIGADVGEDGDAHEIQTDAYFKLRKRHDDSTVSLSNSADAVIYLFNTVPTETDQTFLGALHDGGHGITPLNGIGVLSKIDKNLEQLNNVTKYSKQFEQILFKIMPTSVAVTKILPDAEDALCLRDTLVEWFPVEDVFQMAISSVTAFCHPALPKCAIPADARKKLIEKYSCQDLPWSVFALIARELYNSDNIEKTLDHLKQISGIESLRELINNHFFKRSRLLRCNTVLNELRHILLEISYSPEMLQAEQLARNKDKMIEACAGISQEFRGTIIGLIRHNIDSLDNVKNLKQQVEYHRNFIDHLLAELSDVNESYIDFQKLNENKEQFSEVEIIELSCLFSGQSAGNNIGNKYKYWSRVANCAIQNSARQIIAKTAKNLYAKLLSNELQNK